MSDDEKLTTVSRFKEDGNTLYRDGEIDEAAEKYRTAIGMLEQLLLKFDLFPLACVFEHS